MAHIGEQQHESKHTENEPHFGDPRNRMDDGVKYNQNTDSDRNAKHKHEDVDKEARKRQKIEEKIQRDEKHKGETRHIKKQDKTKDKQQKHLEEGLITSLNLNETRTYVKNGLRYVIPYYFNFQMFGKGRWLGNPILDFFAKEFSQLPRQTYEAKIKRGDIKVNNMIVQNDYIIAQHDIITHRVHRHEPPVVADPISIVYETEEFLVINKPSSMPMHPCGRYRHNTILFQLARQYDFSSLYTVNRLDRLTSGIALLGKNSKAAARFANQIVDRNVHKTYLARVVGEFPTTEVVVDQPILVVSQTQGINSVSPNGKESKTIFNRKSYDKETNTSIVICQPLTGRTHQIRVHLQYIGHPITNDPIYNDDPAVNKLKNRFTSDGKSIPVFNEDDESLSIALPFPSTIETKNNNNNTENTLSTNDSNNNENNNDDSKNDNNNGNDEDNKFRVPGCPDCIPRPDPKPEELFIYLHALKYEGPDWSFETELPLWARNK